MSGSRSGFSVTITAVDAASKQIDAVNNRIKAMSAPAERVTKSLAKLSDTTGITALGSGFRNLARNSLQAFENIGRIAAPLGVLTGAASVAGLARLTSEWANYGSQLGFSSQRSGVAAGHLGALQGAARLAGASAGSLTAGMTTLKDELFNINAGRGAPQTIAAFNTLGIATKTASGQIRTASDVLPELADKIKAIKDPTMQATLATLTLGGAGEELLPFLRRGSAGIAEYTQMAIKYGAVNEKGADAANDLRVKQVGLTLAAEGLGYAIAENLSPTLGPMLQHLTDWISDNRVLISTNVGGWAKDYGAAIGGVAGAVDKAVTSTVGWNKAIEIGIPLIASRAIPPLAALENALARLVAIQIPVWLGTLLGIGAGGVYGAAAVGAGAYGGYKGAVKSGTDIAKAGQVGLTPAGMDDFGNATGYKDAAGRTYSNADADRMINTRPWLGEGNDTTPQAGGPTPPTGNPIWNWVGKKLSGAPGSSAADPRGIRNNNPLNLSYVPGQPGVTGSDGRFGVYPTMAAGVASDTHQLILNQQRGATTLAAQIAKWAPPGENDTAGYIRDVSRRMGLDPNARIDVTNPETARQLVSAMAYRENGRGIADKDIRAGVQMALGPQAGIQGTADAPPANIGGGTGTAPVADATTTVKGSANLVVKLDGFPPGTKTTASTEGNLFSGAPRVETAMASLP